MRAAALVGVLFTVAAVAFASTVKVRIVTPANGQAERVSAHQHIASSPAVEVCCSRAKAQSVTLPLAVPVAGIARSSLVDSWGDPRENGKRAHYGTDIIAPDGMPVVAAAPGAVEKLHLSDAGGTTIYVRSPDRQWSYYYAHLSAYAPNLREGQRLKTGDLIGFVGDSGNAGPGNYHLHFGMSRMGPQDGWWQGVPIDPYPSLAGKSGPG